MKERAKFVRNHIEITLDDGSQIRISYSDVRKALEINKVDIDSNTLTIQPGAANTIYVK